MKTTTTISQWLVRVTGLIQLVLGIPIWTGNADFLIRFHIISGVLLTLSLLVMAVTAARVGVPPGFVILAIAWVVLLPLLGLTQAGLLPGSAHWVIQVVHLLVGLSAIGQSENLARRIRVRLGQSGGMRRTSPAGNVAH